MPDTLHIRPLDARSDSEVALVAERMRLTLIEVEGEAVGGSMYSTDWLRDRVRFHLDPAACTGAVFLAEAGGGAIAGHTIVRVEHDAAQARFGLFSTTYVDPAFRRRGIAAALLARGEAWMLAQGLGQAATWTSASNSGLIALYVRQGYAVAERASHPQTGTAMVRLARALPDLERFVRAQQPVYAQVLAELRRGRKASHWMWFVFPQIDGLGRSALARLYAISGLAEAAAYAEHPVLGPRLTECSRLLLLAHQGLSAREILGQPDDLKLHSCMTLFASAAPQQPAYQAVIDRFFAGRPDAATLALLRDGGREPLPADDAHD